MLTFFIAGAGYAAFVRTTGSSPGFGYGYGYGYSYGYGYGYGYLHGETSHNPSHSNAEYGFLGSNNGTATVTSATSTATSFTVTYATNYLAENYIQYGTTTSMTSSSATSSQTAGTHSIVINGLCSNKYYYRVVSTDAGNNIWYSTNTYETPISTMGCVPGYQEFDPTNVAAVFNIVGRNPHSTTGLTATADLSVTATSPAGNIEVLIPTGTIITEENGAAFDATTITSADVANAVLHSSLITTGTTLQGAIQFGIPGITLYFAPNPVTIAIPVALPDGTYLDLSRSPDGGVTWTTVGFTAHNTDTCINGIGNHPVSAALVAGGYVTTFICQASDFAAYSYTTPQGSSYYYGGGGGAPTNPTSTSTVTTTVTTASTTPSLLTYQQLLTSLIAQLKALILQAKALGIPISPAAEAFLQGNYSFTRDLEFGMTGEDVKGLQIYLNSKGFTVSSSGPGSPGNETTYFGPATQAALIKFQKASGISPAAGYFGPKTRAYISSHP